MSAYDRSPSAGWLRQAVGNSRQLAIVLNSPKQQVDWPNHKTHHCRRPIRCRDATREGWAPEACIRTGGVKLPGCCSASSGNVSGASLVQLHGHRPMKRAKDLHGSSLARACACLLLSLAISAMFLNARGEFEAQEDPLLRSGVKEGTVVQTLCDASGHVIKTGEAVHLSKGFGCHVSSVNVSSPQKDSLRPLCSFAPQGSTTPSGTWLGT